MLAACRVEDKEVEREVLMWRTAPDPDADEDPFDPPTFDPPTPSTLTPLPSPLASPVLTPIDHPEPVEPLSTSAVLPSRTLVQPTVFSESVFAESAANDASPADSGKKRKREPEPSSPAETTLERAPLSPFGSGNPIPKQDRVRSDAAKSANQRRKERKRKAEREARHKEGELPFHDEHYVRRHCTPDIITKDFDVLSYPAIAGGDTGLNKKLPKERPHTEAQLSGAGFGYFAWNG